MSIKFARCGQQIHTLAKAIDKEENFNFKAYPFVPTGVHRIHRWRRHFHLIKRKPMKSQLR